MTWPVDNYVVTELPNVTINPQLDDHGELRTKPLPGYCKACITAKLCGNYKFGFCNRCIEGISPFDLDQLRVALARSVPVDREPETRRTP